MGKKTDTQDAIVQLCLERDGPDCPVYIFTNEEVKEIYLDIEKEMLSQ